MNDKLTVPLLTKKRLKWADLDPESLAFALQYRELLASLEESDPTDEEE